MASLQLSDNGRTLDELIDTYGTDDLGEIVERISEGDCSYEDTLDSYDDYNDLDFYD